MSGTMIELFEETVNKHENCQLLKLVFQRALQLWLIYC